MEAKQRSVRQLRRDKVKIVHMTDAERKAYREDAKRRKQAKEIVEGAGVAIAALSLFIAVLVIWPLVILGGWNLGLVPAADALGGDIEGINFLTAFGLALVLSVLKGILLAIQGKSVIEVKGADKA